MPHYTTTDGVQVVASSNLAAPTNPSFFVLYFYFAASCFFFAEGLTAAFAGAAAGAGLRTV